MVCPVIWWHCNHAQEAYDGRERNRLIPVASAKHKAQSLPQKKFYLYYLLKKLNSIPIHFMPSY